MTTKEQAKQEISKLVNRFQSQLDSYRRTEYNETQVRRDFIDPLFKALGWDIDNSNGAPEAYREVVHEDRVTVQGRLKSPDYSFRRSGGKRLFFVEAKKPSVNVREDASPAYQVRRYAWSAKLSVSIVTDFEEFAVYDCTKKPAQNDRASTSRIKYFTFTDYESEFEYLWNTFSKESVENGNFEKYIKSDTKNRGTTSVDKDFLESLDKWRIDLAKNLAKNNENLDEEMLNFAVQQTIDRIIFLRIAEDRQIEDYLALKGVLQKKGYYKNLLNRFFEADGRYNAGLFDFKKDKITGSIKLDDAVIAEIIEGLYFPQSPYEFSVLPVEILGSAYEQFLGKQIKLTDNHTVKIEEKPEVRKAGGVFYTHENIVHNIISNTIGKLLENKNPEAVSKLKIVDPACGSGSFLLGAYQFMLDWHLNYYFKNPPKKTKTKDHPLTPIGTLTTSEKKRILVNNIFGVDIDVNAVEVTKLSLLLKCLEGETDASIKSQLNLFGEKVLPTLDKNILCGNSLVDLDYSEGQIDFEMDRKINPFNWKLGFPEVYKQKGFDAVIGNPPWGAEFSEDTIAYLRTNFKSAETGTVDSYAAFVEKSLLILKEEGLLGFITPDTFLRKDDFFSFRQLLLKNYVFHEIIEAGPLFSQVRDTWCCVYFIKKQKPTTKTKVIHKKLSRYTVSVEDRLENFGRNEWDDSTEVPQNIWFNKNKLIVGYKANEVEQKIIDKIERKAALGTFEQFKISRGEEGSKLKIKETATGKFKMIIPEDVEKSFVGEGKTITAAGLTSGKITSIYEHPKIWIIRIQKMRWPQRIVAGVDLRKNSAGMKTLQSITALNDNIDSLYYLQALLTSKLINYWCVNYLADDINQSYLSKIPFCIDEVLKPDSTQGKIIQTQRQLVDLKVKIIASNLQTKTDKLAQEISYSENKIDQLVYKLYELTTEEIAVVEGAK